MSSHRAAVPQLSSPTSVDPPSTHHDILAVLLPLLAAPFAALLSGTVAIPALPAVTAELGGGSVGLTWIITVALLANATTTPVWGSISDRYDTRLLVQAALLTLTAGSVISACGSGSVRSPRRSRGARGRSRRRRGCDRGGVRRSHPAAGTGPLCRVRRGGHGGVDGGRSAPRRRTRRHSSRLAGLFPRARGTGRRGAGRTATQADTSSSAVSCSSLRSPSNAALPSLWRRWICSGSAPSRAL